MSRIRKEANRVWPKEKKKEFTPLINSLSYLILH